VDSHRPENLKYYNIKMALVETEWDGVDWIGEAQNRDKWRALVNAVMNLQIPQNLGKLLSGYVTCGPSSSAHLLRVSCGVYGLDFIEEAHVKL
jgi:hypothetical protein